MSRRLFEFECPVGHISEQLVDSEVRIVCCKHQSCTRTATRIVSAPQVRLEGISGSFPGAYDKWERVRAEKLKQERAQKAKHGEPD